NYDILESIENETCYGDLHSLIEDYDYDNATYIEILDVECEETIDYWKFYCDYIGKIFKLDYKITDDSFVFKLLDEHKLNLLICTLIRYLWEHSEYGEWDDNENDNNKNERVEEHLNFFELLYKDKDNLEYTLEEFCLYYSEAGFKNTHNGHQICDSKRIKIK